MQIPVYADVNKVEYDILRSSWVSRGPMMDIITGRAPAPALSRVTAPKGQSRARLAWAIPARTPMSKWCLYWGHGTALSPLAVHPLAFSARYSPFFFLFPKKEPIG